MCAPTPAGWRPTKKQRPGGVPGLLVPSLPAKSLCILASKYGQTQNEYSWTMNSGRWFEKRPIVPTTSRPPFLTPDGKPCFGAEEQYHFRCFNLFREFGDFINQWCHSTPFRLQELQDTKITYREGELDLGPNYGHRYDIYYFQLKVGLLQVHAGRVMMSSAGLHFSEDIRQEEQDVHVDISVHTFSPVIIPFNDVQKYLGCIARMTTSDAKECFYTGHQDMTQRSYVLYAIEQAMMRVMWDNHNVAHDKALPMTLWFSGAPTEWCKHLATRNRR
jgi:hypothetical protein